MVITTAQRDILARLRVDVATGLSTSEASVRRRRGAATGDRHGGANVVRPPVDCPKWVCCLLPCIGRSPSMRQFRLVTPDDAEVLRDSTWVRYDHGSLVVGDVIRLVEGDVVPADCLVVGLGMDRIDASSVVDDDDDCEGGDSGEEEEDGGGGGADGEEITVDARLVTGEIRPARVVRRRNGTVGSGATLYYGSRVLRGSCLAVVIATGRRVALSKLIGAGRWPPCADLSEEVREIARMESEGTGIALVPIS
ncbi:hypothetical protein ACHAW5_005066 [Stephanodiscus triporus]|uniref:P-type ATPase A domain-containing protein n=1 Tax=Stephanodiscus triporus TaxID=2934178 RepID=A0ABD3QUB9_9STRA